MLVLRALGVGDLATAVPALRGLRAATGHRPLVLAAPDWLAPLVRLTGAVDRHLPVAGLAPVRWPVPPGCLAVNLHGRGPQSHELLRAAAPAALRAFACPAAGHPHGPAWRADEHEVRRWCRMLRWYGIDTDPDDLGLLPPLVGPVHPGAAVVHPGAKSPQRRWPAARYAAVARALAGHGHEVVVTGSPAEVPLARRVARAAGLPPAAVLAGRTGLEELAALVAAARVVVSGDTGIAHLATGYQTPSVVLFGPVPPGLWGPPHRPQHRVLWRPVPATAAARDSGPGPHPALRAISVAEVVAAALALAG